MVNEISVFVKNMKIKHEFLIRDRESIELQILYMEYVCFKHDPWFYKIKEESKSNTVIGYIHQC